MSNENLDPEAGAEAGAEVEMELGAYLAFMEISIRQNFIQKVYSILMVQLSITMGFIGMFLYFPSLRAWTYEHVEFFYGVLILYVVLMISLVCCQEVRRRAPMNVILLLLFTVCQGFLLGAAASTYSVDAVILTVGVTAVICLAVTLFAFQTKIDFTGIGGYLLVAGLVLLMFGFLFAFLPRDRFPTLHIVYAVCGTLFFSFYLVLDTQLLIGGRHKYAISPEEYVFAALNIYLDIVNIFLCLLGLQNRGRD